MKKNIFKKTLSIVLAIVIILQIYFLAEPVTAVDDTDGVEVTLTVDSGITISNGDNVIMDPTLGITANSSIGSSAWTVKTNNRTGYTLAVKADTNPALKSPENNTFEDYTEASGTCSDLSYTTRATCLSASKIWTPVPEAWDVVSGAKEFGYSAYGDNTSTATWGTSLSCGSAGAPATSQYYAGFTTSNNVIATKGEPTTTSGVETTICFAAEQDTIYAPSGTYTATITATAATL